jgi:predicted nucleic acid-binding protein
VFYLDTSAATKLVLDEPESDDLRAHLGASQLASSQLTITELSRAVLRRSSGARAQLEQALATLFLISLSVERLTQAATLPPPTLRSLDAIHLATALSVREELDAFVAYDRRLLDAASGLGLPVASPGLELG